MVVINRTKHDQFISYIKAKRIVDVLKSEETGQRFPDISWVNLQLLILEWADSQCGVQLRSGSKDIYADLGLLFNNFIAHCNKHKSDFFKAINEIEVWDPKQVEYLPTCLFELLIKDLVGSSDHFEAKMIQPHDFQRIRSIAFELAHYLLNLRQRFDGKKPIIQQPQLTHMLKIHSMSRIRPKREIDFHHEIHKYLLGIQYQELLVDEWKIIQEDSGRTWLLEVWEHFLKYCKIEKVAPFQLKCFISLLNSALLKDSEPLPYMITAGTGFGKTEAFLFPILFYSTINLLRKKRRSYGPDAILVYPRIDLCNNQLERYLEYAHLLKKSVLNSGLTSEILEFVPDNLFCVALGHSGVRDVDDKNHEQFKVKCPICSEEGHNGFIMLRKLPGGYQKIPFCTNDESNHDVTKYIIPELKYDTRRFEVAITTTETLHRRLMDLHGSQTLWKNKNYLPRFIVFDEIHIYEGQAGSHVSNLTRRLRVFLKNIKTPDLYSTPNLLPPIFVGSSATIGNPDEVGAAMFGFSKVLIQDRVITPEVKETEPLGREYIYMLKTPPVRKLHNTDLHFNRPEIVTEQSTLLQALIVLWHAMRKKMPINGSLGKYRLLTFSDSIDTVWRITKNLDDAEGANNKKLYSMRIPSGRYIHNNDLNSGNIMCPKLLSNTFCCSPPHHFLETCKLYQLGECWWSIGLSPDSFLRPMQIVARISGFTRAPANFPSKQSLDQWDCMVATSTLEVGFDHSELIATAQFKAPPNPASFQQRKGRGGRGIEDTPLTLIVLGNSPGDLFAFKHEERYFEPTVEDLRIKFDEKNKYIRNQHVMSAVYDFLSWNGITKSFPDIYKKCDLYTALNKLKEHQNGLIDWIYDLYFNDGLGREDCVNLVRDCLIEIEQAVVYLGNPFPGISNSLELFRRQDIPQDMSYNLRRRIHEGASSDFDLKAYIILKAAERYKENYLHPPDYFNMLPIDNHGRSRDGSWVIPKTFIPTPMGGYIEVETSDNGHIKHEMESKLQALATYLPGGFKHRWRFKLWQGEWLPVTGQVECANISNLVENAEELGSLGDNLAGFPKPAPIGCFDSNNTYLVNPRKLKVYAAKESFMLTPDCTRLKIDGDLPGGVRLLKEPTAVAQTLDLIKEIDEVSAKLRIDDETRGIQIVNFGQKELLRLFHRNLVNCYPSSSERQCKSPISIPLKFYDYDHSRFIIPTVKMKTQSLTLEGSITQEFLKDKEILTKKAMTQSEHYWRLVYRLIWTEGFINRSFKKFKIHFSYDCISVLKALRFIDYYQCLNSDISLAAKTPEDIKEVYDRCRKMCEKLQLDLFKNEVVSMIPQYWLEIREGILKVAQVELYMQIAESYAQSIAMALCRDVADKTNTNLDLIRNSINVCKVDDYTSWNMRICVYDNIEGGNGTVSSYIERIGNEISLKNIFTTNRKCDTDTDERNILKLFQDKNLNADHLYSLSRDPKSLQDYFITSMASKTIADNELSAIAFASISRLTPSIAKTAFYQGIADGYRTLKNILGREPGEEEIACYINEYPIADLRGAQLFEKFKKLSGGISELIPQISEIMPLCHGSCPDCLGDSRLSFEKGDKITADRALLGGE